MNYKFNNSQKLYKESSLQLSIKENAPMSILHIEPSLLEFKTPTSMFFLIKTMIIKLNMGL